MKFVPSTVFLTTFLLGAANATNADDSPATFLQTWAETWKTSDVDKMMAFYDTAKETVALRPLGHLYRGPAEIRKMYRAAFDKLKYDDVTVTPITQGQHGSVAWATCRYESQTRLKDNSRYAGELRASFVMRKIKGSWKITLEHFSFIPDGPPKRAEDNE